MEEERMDSASQDKPVYQPRPRWQVWLARIGLAIFILFVVLYYITIFRGGR